MSDGGINKVIKILAVVLLLPIGIAIPLLSVESYYAPSTTQAQSQDSDLAAREKAYKAAYKQRISLSLENRIKLRCLAVQANLKTLDERAAVIKTARETAYDHVLEQLNNLVKGLQAQAYDTTKLEASVKILSDDVTSFKGTMKDYKQEMDDLTAIDCTKDPVSFKATLEAARRSHLKLIGIVQDIRDDIVNTIKPTLSQVRQDLVGGDAPKTQKKGGSSGSGN